MRIIRILTSTEGSASAAASLASRRPVAFVNLPVSGGMSSRLFQSVREEAGLAYSVYSGLDFHRDSGQLSVHMGVAPERGRDALALVRRELEQLVGRGLQTGFRHALQPDPLPRSLRPERIALGIDLPELDTVPLWSVRRADGAVAIPFVEFIISEISKTLQVIAVEAGLAGSAEGDDLVVARADLRRVLEQASPGSSTAAPELPRLGDIFLSRDLLEKVCGPEGILRTVVRRCEVLLAVDSARPDH